MCSVKLTETKTGFSKGLSPRIIKAYIAFHLKRNPKWDLKEVSKSTPHDIQVFITQKCGVKANNFEGKKVGTIPETEGYAN